LTRLDSEKEIHGSNLDFLAPDLGFLSRNLEFLAVDLEILAPLSLRPADGEFDGVVPRRNESIQAMGALAD
jgi:hypothetical protein